MAGRRAVNGDVLGHAMGYLRSASIAFPVLLREKWITFGGYT